VTFLPAAPGAQTVAGRIATHTGRHRFKGLVASTRAALNCTGSGV
jgi:hypothetical protein